MGKSALIDLLSSLSLEQVRDLSPAGASDEFCHWVVDSVHVSIDFNGTKVGLDESIGANGHTFSYYISEVRLLSLFLSLICW